MTSDKAGYCINPSQLQAVNADEAILQRLKELIESKTRFVATDIRILSSEQYRYQYRLQSSHTLQGQILTEKINGSFSPTQYDERSDDPQYDASADLPQRVPAATVKLQETIRASRDKHVAPDEGIYLGANRRHWNLVGCSPCNRTGKLTCGRCQGGQTETCYTCSGAAIVTCPGRCIYGQEICSYCHGSGYIDQIEYFYVNGIAQSATRQKGCSRCRYGKNDCARCYGSGRVGCDTCQRTGEIGCRSCDADGWVICGPCDGTAAVGETACAVVTIGRHSQLTSLNEKPEELSKYVTDDGFSLGIVGLSKDLVLTDTSISGNDSIGPTAMISATYTGSVDVNTLVIKCRNQTYNVAACGVNHEWARLDNVIQSFLNTDLSTLSESLPSSIKELLWKSQAAKVAPALKNVLNSELNAEVIRAMASNNGSTQCTDATSAEYNNNLSLDFSIATQVFYADAGRRIGLIGFIISSIIAGLCWAISGKEVAIMAIIAVLPLWLWVGGGRAKRGLMQCATSESVEGNLQYLLAKRWHRWPLYFFLLGSTCVQLAIAVFFLPEKRLLTQPTHSAAITNNLRSAEESSRSNANLAKIPPLQDASRAKTLQDTSAKKQEHARQAKIEAQEIKTLKKEENAKLLQEKRELKAAERQAARELRAEKKEARKQERAQRAEERKLEREARAEARRMERLIKNSQ